MSTTSTISAMDTLGSWMNPIEFREVKPNAKPFKLNERAGELVTDCDVEVQAVVVILTEFEK